MPGGLRLQGGARPVPWFARERHKPRYRFTARPHVQFLINAPDVGVDRSHADAQGLGDFLVGIAARQQPQDFAFPRGKILRFLLRRRRLLLEPAHHLAGDVTGHGRSALVHLLDGRQQLLPRRAFQQIAGGARRQRVEDMVAVS